MLRKFPPLIRNGAWPSSEEMLAPIFVSGSITRRMGRRERELSPIISLANGWPATMPDNIRIVDPEFPQSSVSDGAFNMPARPAIEISPLFLVMSAPSERRQLSVLAQSAPVEKLRSRVVPSA